MIPFRGDVYVVNFDPTIGSEIKKTRPAVVLQNNVGNRHSAVTIVAAISSQFGDELYPTEVFIEPPEGGLEKKCVVLLNQIRTVDKRRLTKKLGVLKRETMMRVDQALEISLGLAGV
ncbi:PemK family transcriptional regulator [Candidatus Kaiserbacteria bacterium RIFCSPLOWO2_01_FULL_53_17]|uniref:mRNA interferase n=1 Tax=Candidatus Kaiserbacteria bacterium RIFCSPLOWO2_01_FULL_53_17 TaxID=1798511 RepID=A0A1F6EGT0_9BACT|nr:MAG: PemK family transcriptional regulator [Candidatus Kaiserbacteria bacterium RIFCSPLOWO2_01_FULL_53_17]